MTSRTLVVALPLLLGACMGSVAAPAPQAAPAAPAAAGGGAPPATDLFLADLVQEGSRLAIRGVRNITGHSGYDNQPSFTPDGRGILFTSRRDGAQTDIYRFAPAANSTVRLTSTPESEYSPTVMPDGRSFSVIRVEADSTQRLWAFGLAGEAPRVLLRDVKPVGYHAWMDGTRLALFVLGAPPTLQLASVASGSAVPVASNIGRSIHRVPGRNAVSYVEKVSETEWWIVEMDLGSRRVMRLVRTLQGSEDFAWHPTGALLMASGSQLHRWTRESGDDWSPVADLAGEGVAGITRLAVSPDGSQLALVADDR